MLMKHVVAVEGVVYYFKVNSIIATFKPVKVFTISGKFSDFLRDFNALRSETAEFVYNLHLLELIQLIEFVNALFTEVYLKHTITV